MAPTTDPRDSIGSAPPMASTRGWLRYRLPQQFVRRDSAPLCIGQKQRWFLLRMVGGEDRLVVLHEVDDVLAGHVGCGEDDDPAPVEGGVALDPEQASVRLGRPNGAAVPCPGDHEVVGVPGGADELGNGIHPGHGPRVGGRIAGGFFCTAGEVREALSRRQGAGGSRLAASLSALDLGIAHGT